MSQSTVFGEVEVEVLRHLRRVDGTEQYFRDIDGVTVELSRDEFVAYGGVEG